MSEAYETQSEKLKRQFDNKLALMPDVGKGFDCSKLHSKCNAACCSLCPLPKKTFERNTQHVQRVVLHTMDADDDNVIPMTQDHKCCFLSADLSCAIYDDRPDLCRKFGNEEHAYLSCFYQDKNGNERSRQQIRSLHKKTQKLNTKLINVQKKIEKNAESCNDVCRL